MVGGTALLGWRVARRAVAVVMAAMFSLLSTISAHAEYTLATGDVLRVLVFGESAYPLQVVVDDRGMISLPLLGEISASGVTPADLVTEIKSEFKQRQLLVNPFVQVEIEEYRPFFIAGAVANPGSYPYRPGITVRHALAIAGGFRALTVGDTAPALRIADLRGERAGLLMEEFRYRVRHARLLAESRDEEAFLAPPDPPMELSSDLVTAIIEGEQDQLEARWEAFKAEIAYLESSLARATRDAASLENAYGERAKAANFQLEELEVARGLREKGLMTNSNLLDAERTQNRYRVDLAEAEVRRANAQQEVANLESELRRKREARTMELLVEIQAAQLEIGKVQSSLRYVTDKLLFVSQYGEHRTFDDLLGSVRIVLYRGGEASKSVPASEGTKLMAGDVVEVSVIPNQQFFSPGEAGATAPQSEAPLSDGAGSPLAAATADPLLTPAEIDDDAPGAEPQVPAWAGSRVQ